jgi:hypothetical protein
MSGVMHSIMAVVLTAVPTSDTDGAGRGLALQKGAATWQGVQTGAHTVGVRDQALQPTGKPNPQWLPRGLQPPYVPVPFLNPPPVHWW